MNPTKSILLTLCLAFTGASFLAGCNEQDKGRDRDRDRKVMEPRQPTPPPPPPSGRTGY